MPNEDPAPKINHRNIRFVNAEDGSYGDFLRKERIARNWSQVELAERVTKFLYPSGNGVLRQGMISAYERGETQVPHPEIAAAIDEAFGFPRGTLMGRVDGPGRGGRRREENAVLPGDIVLRQPTSTMRSLWETVQDLTDQELKDLLRFALTLSTSRELSATTSHSKNPKIESDVRASIADATEKLGNDITASVFKFTEALVATLAEGRDRDS